MSEQKTPRPVDDLSARIDKARGRQRRPSDEDRAARGWGVALQIAIEMVGTLAVAIAIGWGLDEWLATGPLFFVVMFFLGAAAGGLSVYRRAQRMVGGDLNEDVNAKTSDDDEMSGRLE